MLLLLIIFLMAVAITVALVFTTGMYSYWIILWCVLGLIGGVLVFVLYFILFITIGAKTSPKSKFKQVMLWNLCWIFLKFYHVHVTYEGVENVPKKETFVIYSNHKSNMDPVCIYIAIHRTVSAIGKKSLFTFWPMTKITKCYGAIAFDRDNDREAAKSMIEAIKVVKGGLPMIIFPEGGIKSRDVEEMVNLRAGAYKLAMKASAPIIPTTIIGSSEISKRKRFQRKDVHIIFHKPITKDEYQGKNTTEVGTYVENMINADIHKYEEKK